jgi:hypothetical protein
MNHLTTHILLLTGALVISPGCGDDTIPEGASDAGVGVAEDVRRDGPRPADADVGEGDTVALDSSDAPGDALLDPSVDLETLSYDVTLDSVIPPEPTGACVEGGDGARGRIEFEDGTPLAAATVALIVEGRKHLGLTDEDGQFFIQAPCTYLPVEVALFESTNYPIHPSLWNLPVGRFDAATEEPTFIVDLVTVTGVIIDIHEEPIADARLEASLTDGVVSVYNEEEADELGQFAVNVVPWSGGPYNLTARGPQDSNKRYRTATLIVVVDDPPPDPSTFKLFEDRCEVYGTIRTSEGTALEWLYLRVEGEPYPDGAKTYFSFLPGNYYERGEPDVLYDNLPLWCGTQTFRFWNAVWLDPSWPCRDHSKPDQLCLNNYPMWLDREIVAPSDEGVEIRVVRIAGVVTDDSDDPTPQRDVTVRVEASYQWGENSWDRLTVFNETVTDRDGEYSMVVLPLEDAAYTVTTRIRDDDARPLGEYDDSFTVTEPTHYDIALPEAPPRCVIEGTVHSSEGRDFNEVLVYFQGTEIESLDPLYVDPPWYFFTEEPEVWYRYSFPDEEVPFVPMLCGIHDLWLHSADWPSCNVSPDEICFTSWPWWDDEVVDEPIPDGIEIPVVHVSGHVTTEETGEPVEGAVVSAMAGFPPFFMATNLNGTDATGLYDFVVMPGMEWGVSVAVGDDHPMNLDPVGTTMVINDAVEINFEMPPGPDRCPLSGTVHTSEGVDLQLMEFQHYGAMYGMSGWVFRYDEPGLFYRYGLDSILLDAIPLICSINNMDEDDEEYLGPQDMVLRSRRSSYNPSCQDSVNFDQICLDSFDWWAAIDLIEPVHGIEIPVVWVTGQVTLDGDGPIQNATIEAGATIFVENDDGETTRRAGHVSNYAVTRPDGSYRLVVYPSELSEYQITITTPLDLDLGQITHRVTIFEDTVVDADFSSVTED